VNIREFNGGAELTTYRMMSRLLHIRATHDSDCLTKAAPRLNAPGPLQARAGHLAREGTKISKRVEK
jgi:hypothetical protein